MENIEDDFDETIVATYGGSDASGKKHKYSQEFAVDYSTAISMYADMTKNNVSEINIHGPLMYLLQAIASLAKMRGIIDKCPAITIAFSKEFERKTMKN